MSESFPAWIAFIAAFAVVLGALRGTMLRSQSFVPRGRRHAEPTALPAPAAAAASRTQVRRHRPSVGTAPGAAQPGLAR